MGRLENRRATRYYSEVPIELAGGTGLTRDYSTDGIYFTTDQVLGLGEQVQFTMCLTNQGPTQMVKLTCQAEVVRVEMVQDKMGTAVAINECVAELLFKNHDAADEVTTACASKEPIFRYQPGIL
ncbi:PilZ domain-containing protein [Geomonas nitrogeniifigens]|uniref:PilZ domain-containing protein n=1 Tax=Geomonas diazotrophica TaxID=2843197 RepID=A0ABX8JMK2_9BACT|nr:PilZ domain-containing protein [Geomonas nitrogeniifigens]QWV98968.1 PilZ domain-containing protein [Geomonas nitrogeniifigens]QXE88134.1 PilZ domain-containing protein [Geomonas nitrogeniifigens]